MSNPVFPPPLITYKKSKKRKKSGPPIMFLSVVARSLAGSDKLPANNLLAKMKRDLSSRDDAIKCGSPAVNDRFDDRFDGGFDEATETRDGSDQ